MAQVINTNVASLNAQRNLNMSQSALSTSLQRLSSGLRINSAKDDAAGLAISDRMTSQIRGLTQAARNANDGISLAQTAEGALNEIGNNLQRLRELSVQSSNATNSASDRASLQAEATQLTQEITRVAEQTSFNGLKLLNSSFTAQNFQVGANSGETISVSAIADSRTSALGGYTLTGDGTITGNTVGTATNGVTAMDASTNFTITTEAGTSGAISYGANESAKTIAKAIQDASSSLGVTATATNSTTLSGLSGVGNGTGAVTFALNGKTVTAVVTDQNDLSSLVSAINGVQKDTGVTASFETAGNKSKISLSTVDGRNIDIASFAVANGGSVTNESITFGTVTLTEGGATTAAIQTGIISLSSSRGSISTANASGQVFAIAGTNNSTFTSVAALDLSTAKSASNAIAALDAALAQVNTSRGDLGAYQNRFTSAINNLQTTSENVSAARSRIQDADFAAETASLTRNQILQQAGTAMLAQANSLPQNVLSLLK